MTKMTEERWQRLTKCTWFRTEQDEVIAYVEELRLERRLHTPRRVRHSDLIRRTVGSPFRSVCPLCEDGALLVRRDQKTMRLQREDNCVSCGQLFVYQDDEIAGEKFHE